MSDYIIEMLGITKYFPGIIANDNITLQLKKSEIHALAGENGAGKSTLMSILFGLYKPEKGEIRKNGIKVCIRNPNEATRLGIGMVHQHFRLVDAFTVLDNIILGSEDTSLGFLKKSKARKKVTELSEKYGLSVDLDAKIENISVGMQQRVEILKMLYRENEIFIFDEPTAVLSHTEIKMLTKTLKNLRDEGKSILFITHKLDEIMAISDRVTVLRKGRSVGTKITSETNKNELCSMMVGRSVELKVKKEKTSPGKAILQVVNMSVRSKLHKNQLAVKNVSFKVHSGEIVSLAGIDGNGQSELVGGITGLDRTREGKVFILGEDVTELSVRSRNRDFLSHIPENRHKHGLVLDFPLIDNIILQRYLEKGFQHLGFIRKEKVRDYAEALAESYDIRCAEGIQTITRSISGGNQQKAVIAREFDRDKPLIIAVQPTRGLDIGAIEYIHSQIIKKRDEGHAVLLISYELDEIMNLSDRILIIHEGSITGEFTPESTSTEELGLYMAGVKKRGIANA